MYIDLVLDCFHLLVELAHPQACVLRYDLESSERPPLPDPLVLSCWMASSHPVLCILYELELKSLICLTFPTLLTVDGGDMGRPELSSLLDSKCSVVLPSPSRMSCQEH